MVWEPTGRRSHNATMEIMPLWSEWRLNWWGRTYSSCVLVVSDRCAVYTAGWSHHLTCIWVKRLNEKGWVFSGVSSYYLWRHWLWNFVRNSYMIRWNGCTSGDFPSRSLLGLLAGTPQQDYLHSRRRLVISLPKSLEVSSTVHRWDYESDNDVRQSEGHTCWGSIGHGLPTSLGSGVIITGMWWTRRSGGCLLISDWMMPSKQMSIWGIESAPRRAQWYSAAWPVDLSFTIHSCVHLAW